MTSVKVVVYWINSNLYDNINLNTFTVGDKNIFNSLYDKEITNIVKKKFINWLLFGSLFLILICDWLMFTMVLSIPM